MDTPLLFQLIFYYENNNRRLSELEQKALLHLREMLATVALTVAVPR